MLRTPVCFRILRRLSPQFQSVFPIHDILVWIRIRRSMPLTNGSRFGSGCCYFRHLTSRTQQKKIFKSFSTYFLLFECSGTYVIYIIFQRSNVQKKSQNSRNQVFSYYLCLMIGVEGLGSKIGSGSTPLTGSGSGTLIAIFSVCCYFRYLSV
jgi:hypothetical protein